MAGKRHSAREMAVQMLYQQDMGGAALPQLFHHFDLSEFVNREARAARKSGKKDVRKEDDDGRREPPSGEVAATVSRAEEADKAKRRVQDAFQHARSLVEGTDRHRQEIDELIRSQADNWRLERMPVVDRNILRLAVYEMLYQPEVPKLVVLDEAIELAKRYGSDQSGRFINGLLDGLLKQRAFPGSMT